MTIAEIITASGTALSSAFVGLAAIVWALRRRR
jgi:hypothetical protein